MASNHRNKKPIDICTRSPNGAHHYVNRWKSRLWKCLYCEYVTDVFPMSWEEHTRSLRTNKRKTAKEADRD